MAINSANPVNRGNQKKFQDDHFTRNEWNLLRSKQRYGTIKCIVTDNSGESTSFPSRRQARKYMRTCNTKPCKLSKA